MIANRTTLSYNFLSSQRWDSNMLSNSYIKVSLEKMNDILSDQKKFSKVSLKDDTLLNFAINQEKHVDKVLKKLVESKSMTEKN